jgi:hypothetical protein
LDHVIHLGDANPLGAVIHWGDGTLTNPGLLQCGGVTNYDPCNVYGTHRYASEGTYTITVEYDEPPAKTVAICTIFGCITLPIIPFGNGPHHSETSTATISPVGDFVILSIGDSIASGEGDPVVPFSGENFPPPVPGFSWGFWDDPYSNGPDYIGGNPTFPSDEQTEWPNQSFPCHRSGFAGPAQAAAVIQSSSPGVTFVHYACSGAKINAGDTPKDTVQDAVGQLRVARGRLPRIDTLIISAGFNSFTGSSFGSGFGELFKFCVLHPLNPCSQNQQFLADVANSLNALPQEYTNLAKEINCINPVDGGPEPSCTDPQNQIPKTVFITEYMDPTHDQNGSYVDFCAAAPDVSASEWQFFHDSILHPVNQIVDSFQTYADQAGLAARVYTVQGIEQDFFTHGLCAGDQRWLLTPADSLGDLGINEPYDASANGSGHPNGPGQADYRDRIFAAIVQNSYAITTASAATADGMSYTFGTWTTQNVAVTLSATNPIQQSGVKQILYAVDNSNCNPQGWPTNCSTYSGPFTISTSGQHTVTFSSFNASGLLGPFQTVQVWVGTAPATTLTITANNVSRQYEAADPAFTATYAGFVNGDTPAVLTGALACAANDTAGSPVGTYLINCSGLSSTSYSITYVPGLLSITPAPLTISANNVARPYGQANPSFTGTIVGLLNGDNVSASYSSIATTASVVGSYAIAITPIDPSGKLANYAVTLNNGTLTINSVPLTTTANNASRQYGAADPSFTASYSGFVNGDTSAALGGTLTCAANDTAGSPAGTYAITCSGLSSSNYSITYASGILSITATPLTITANNASRQYGQANPPLNSGTYSGFVNGDTSSSLVGALNCTTIASPVSPVGAYPITCAGLSSQNYSINFVSGTLTVTVAPLTITAANMSKTYGATLTFAGMEFTTSGLLNADKVASVTLASLGTPAAATVAGSLYAIVPSAAVGTGLGNYNISYVNGTLIVTPALLTITGNNATKILNAANPTLNWKASGFVNGENISVFTANPTCTTTATTTSPVGSCSITCTGAGAANYTFVYVPGTLNVLYAAAIGHMIQPPINADGTSVYKQGRTVPAKFSVYDANGVSIGTPGVVSSFFLTGIVSGTTTTAVQDVVDTNNPDMSFRWDGQQWIFNITTANLSGGSTYIYTIALNDGSTIMFQFGLL